ncbi:hypothetical protein [Brevibacillus reuszeri]|uniref:hypothetical protein n=1 Tax=Brevibacillus reuszeri TaxID=54915 RepID=UPI002896CD8F|nr:hypothetical protein [Brevibacillus reuszeri]
MNQSEGHLQSIVNGYLSRIANLNVKHESYLIRTLREIKSEKQSWNQHPGIYYFAQNDVIKYVGKANLDTGLRRRIYNQIEAFGEVDRWDTVIKDDSVTCGMIVFPSDDWQWIATLELLLIEKLRPEYNKRLP